MKTRRAIPAKIRALLQQEVNSCCPFCTSIDVDHFQIHHIDENPENDDPGNLLMLCPTCHSKITKGDIPSHEVRRKKLLLHNTRPVARAKPVIVNTFYGPIETAVVGDHNAITYKITTTKTKKQKYPPGCIGYDVVKANYIAHLIDRYHDLKKWEVGEDGMRYGIFPSMLKKKFKIGATRTIYNIPENQFELLAEFIQSRIRGTKLARMKPRQRYYSSFEDYGSDRFANPIIITLD
jgi:hypothetical protein